MSSDSFSVKLNKKDFLENILVPVSYISQNSNIKITDKSIFSLVSNEMFAFYCKSDIDTNYKSFDGTPLNLSIRGVTKFKKLISCIPEDSFSLGIKSNHLKYESDNIRFKYYLLDDGIIKDPPINVDKINEIDCDYEFIISLSKIKELLQLNSAISLKDGNDLKVYFKFTENGVYAELTDKAMDNSDSVDILISKEYTGNTNKIGIPIVFELLKYLNYVKCSMFKVKYSSDKKVFIFTGERDKYICHCLTSSLKN